MKYNRSNRIPGVSGRRVPGSARMPKARGVGGFKTNVPWQSGNGDEWGSAIFREYHRQQVRDTKGRFGGGWGFAWIGLEGVADNLEGWAGWVTANIRKAAELLAAEMERDMKANAPWEDRTFDARAGLQAKVVFTDPTHFTIFLGHGKDIFYGIFLETRFGGRFAIILPTAQKFGPMLEDKIRTMT